MGKKVLESVATSLVVGFVMFLASILTTYLFSDKTQVLINALTQIDANRFQLTINIMNYDKRIDGLRIRIPENIGLNDIRTSQAVNIEKIDNNYGSGRETVLEIRSIAENQKLNVVILSDAGYDEHEVRIENTDASVNTEYYDEFKSPFASNLKYVITLSTVYILISVISSYVINGYSEKRIQGYQDVMEERDKFSRDITNNLKMIQSRLAENKKRELILYARLRDYSRELDFWRNTIRRLLYNSKSSKNEAEAVIKSITESLKTYQTLKNDKMDFELINTLAALLNDKNTESPK